MFVPELGVSLVTLSLHVSDELISALEASAIATLEVTPRLFEGQGSSEQRDLLRVALSRTGIRAATIHAHFGGAYDLSVLDETAFAYALATVDVSIDLAVELDAPIIVMHASAEPVAASERQARIGRAQEAFQDIQERCRAAGKKVAVELLPRTCLGNTVNELFRLLEPLDPDVFGVCLDTNHLMDRYQSLPDVVRQLGDRLMTLHLSDYDGIDEKHWPPGRGVLDWAGFMAALSEIDYGGPFNYECKPEGETPLERARNLEANFDWLSGLLLGS